MSTPLFVSDLAMTTKCFERSTVMLSGYSVFVFGSIKLGVFLRGFVSVLLMFVYHTYGGLEEIAVIDKITDHKYTILIFVNNILVLCK